MNLTPNYTSNTHLPNLKLLFLPSKPFQAREFRVYGRRRFKPYRRFSAIRCELGSLPPNPFETLFQSLITQYPSVNSLDLFAPALGFASGVALYLSRLKSRDKSGFLDIGEWILFASPTPFNRFVLLRCPSISFQGSDLLEDVNERLVKEERHYVTLNRGRIQVRSYDDGERDLEDAKLTYQRVCVSTEDGGVVSLDWPSNLNLEEERGLDSTLLLVPGTPEGSMDKNVRSFVIETLKRGLFPVVMNPRGCAGSPLTTSRLFTAADSDDISIAITFINKARPWTTLMGVGWGYGANMLTKYLAEVGQRTPLTAATCIDNPFDLDEATRSSPYDIVTDQKLTSGLVDILQTNKALFQGKTKGFDVEKALLAKSVRDFEQAISMVSYGFEAIEDFYSKSSTRNVIGDVKIPVLFIQSDNGMVPVFSVPRNLIAENPFTSLLLCSCLPSSIIDSDRSALPWCQLLTIEWLTAVELGLLKGRHPLLTDIDVTINPSKGLAVVEEVRSGKKPEVSKLLDLTRLDTFNGYSIEPAEDLLEKSENNIQQDLQSNLKLEDTSLKVKAGPLQQTSSTNVDLTEDESVGSVDSEHGQVVQTAQVVINMLDVTMPGTLTEEEKKKVLAAVGQGETLMKALEDAVPEDVRGKLTAAVTGILHARGSDLKFDRVLGIAQDADTLSGKKNQEKFRGASGAGGLFEDQSPLTQVKRTSNSGDGSHNDPSGMDETAGGTDTEAIPLEKSPNSTNSSQSQESNSEVGPSGSFRKETSESRGNNVRNEELKEKGASDFDHSEKGLETGAKPTHPSHPDGVRGFEVAAVAEQKNQSSGIAQTGTNEENNVQKVDQKSQDFSSGQSKLTTTSTKEELSSPPMPSEHQTDTNEENNIQTVDQKSQDFSDNQSKMTPTATNEEPSLPPMPSEQQALEWEVNDNEKEENKNVQRISHQNRSTNSDSSAAAFNVSQAFDALTGMDDSTQLAINSVFGVIENMLSQFEESSDSEVKDGKHVEHKLGENENCNSQDMDPNTSVGPPVDDNHDGMYLQNGSAHVEEHRTQSLSTINGNSVFNSQNCTSDGHQALKESKMNRHLVDKRILVDKLDGHRHVNRTPQHIAAGSYGNLLYNDYLHRYLVLKIPTKSLDLNTTTELLLDYFPEEGQWKLLEQPQNMETSSGNTVTCEEAGLQMNAHSSAKSSNAEEYIEPPYVILDTEMQQEPVKEFITSETMDKYIDSGDDKSEELIKFVKSRVLDSLKMEVGRKLNAAEMKEMKPKLVGDLERVANAISLAVVQSKVHQLYNESKFLNVEGDVEKVGTLDSEHIIRTISSSVQETSYLRKVIPVGVIVGSSLAALRKYFHVATAQDNGQRGSLIYDDMEKPVKKNYGNVNEVREIDQLPEEKPSLHHPIRREGTNSESDEVSKNPVMVGAVTAALGASALLLQQKGPQVNDTAESSPTSLKMKYHHRKEPDKLEVEVSEKNQSNVVTSLAEKAMSVAGPVVPTKEDGEVDQDRLVAMLAELGQKGGLLRLVGKIALLWGGIRGAMSLTDRLISFLHLAERPLLQRIFGFVGMILVLWSPVAVPLLPTLVQSWTTSTPSTIAELACIIGLYTAIMILVMLWGKRIRGYQNALEQYGLDFTSSPKLQLLKFLKGLVGGMIFVYSIHAVNAFLGYASFSWPAAPPSFHAMTWLRVYGHMVLVVVQGTIMASAIALVEELMFRSWLPQEIAVDLGHHRGIIISGLAFSLFQRSLRAIPGLWLLSLSLSGAKQRNGGSLSIPMGLRAGIIASTFFLQKCGFLVYKSNSPLWITGTHPFQPFSGIVGLLISLSLAILLYPRQTSQNKESQE